MVRATMALPSHHKDNMAVIVKVNRHTQPKANRVMVDNLKAKVRRQDSRATVVSNTTKDLLNPRMVAVSNSMVRLQARTLHIHQPSSMLHRHSRAVMVDSKVAKVNMGLLVSRVMVPMASSMDSQDRILPMVAVRAKASTVEAVTADRISQAGSMLYPREKRKAQKCTCDEIYGTAPIEHLTELGWSTKGA
jgi:phage/plasmid-associated DNA primase